MTFFIMALGVALDPITVVIMIAAAFVSRRYWHLLIGAAIVAALSSYLTAWSLGRGGLDASILATSFVGALAIGAVARLIIEWLKNRRRARSAPPDDRVKRLHLGGGN